LFSAGTPTIERNIISGNSSTERGGGIDLVNFSDATIVGNLIVGNSAPFGGGISWLVVLGEHGPTLVNNTLAHNNSPEGSAIFADGFDANTQLVNNLLVAPPGQTAVFCGDFNDLNPPVFRFNNVYSPSGAAYGGICQDQTGLNGNIFGNPLFTDADAGDYHLLAGSPAIDSGDNAAPLVPTTDLDDDARAVDGNGDGTAVVDIGADEFSATPSGGCSYSISPTAFNTGAGAASSSVNVTTAPGCPWTATSNNLPFLTVTGGSSGNGNGTVNFSVTANVVTNTSTATRIGTLTIAGRTFTVTQTGCGYSLTPTSATYDASGGAGMVEVTAPAACSWTAVSNTPAFLAVTGGSPGTANGTVTYTVGSNTGAVNVANPQRTGSLTIAGQTFTVNQTGCTFGIAPVSASFGSAAATGAVTVTTPSACSWTVAGLPAWASTTSGGSGTGSGTSQYSVLANATTLMRSQLITVAALAPNFTLTQLGTSLKPLVPGTRTTFSLANSVEQFWASIEAVAGRSYCAQVTPGVTAINASTPSLSAFRSNSTTPLGPSGTRRTCFVAPATESVLFKTTQSDGGVRPHVLSVVETTLWANWWFVGGDYSSYTILRNTTELPISAIVTWRDGQGAIVGGQSTALPAGGVIFYDARTATTTAVAGSVEIAHDGELGALEGSATTLSATIGLSFDTVLTRRSPP
jgi:hypothetical protein